MGAGILVAMSAVTHARLGMDAALNLQTMTLSFFACVSFTLIAGALTHWSVTRTAGEMLVGRIVNAVENWEKETLRSFVEMSVWLGVMWSTFSVTHRFGMALVCGTMSGVAAALCGEALTGACRELQQQLRIACGESSEGSTSLASGSGLLLLIYGSVGLSMIYHHVSDIVIAGLLAGAGGASILVAARLITWWAPTRRAGIMLQDRILDTRQNWRSFPLRSAIEAAMFLGVTVGVYAGHHSLLLAIQAGFLTGMTVCLLGEIVAPTQATLAGEKDPSSTLVTICACVWGAASGCHWIFADMPTHTSVSLRAQICLAIVGGVLLHVAGRMVAATGWGRRIAAKLQRRLFLSLDYLREHPLQTASEMSCSCAAAIAAWRVTRGVQTTVLLGGLALLVAVLATDWICRSTVTSPSTPRGAEDRAPRRVASVAPPDAHARAVTLAELRSHSTRGDCWVAVHGRVYDVSDWHDLHPGGRIILDYAGRDASDQFELFHPPSVKHKLRSFLVGSLVDAEPEPASTTAYRTLRAKLWEEGYFEPSFAYSLMKQLLSLTCIAAGASLLLAAPPTPLLHLVVAPLLLALGVQQAAFLAHDTMHNCVFRERKRGITWQRQLLGQFNAGFVTGISRSMWLEEHNMHHAYTLRPHVDPQFTYFPLWLQTAKEVPKWLGALPTHRKARRVVWLIARLLNRTQHLTWLPLVMGVGRFNLIAISWSFALKRHSYTDVLAMAIHLMLYAALLGYGLPNVRERLIFTLVHYIAIGTLHVQLLASHMMAEQFTEEEEAAMGVFKTQLLTTRNIRSHWWSHWFHGGLEHQIEHHLFPQLPRHQLSRVAPMVRTLADQHGIQYMELGFHSAVFLCLHELRNMSSALAAFGNPNL